MTRDTLKPREGLKSVYSATFKRYGQARGYSRSATTMLLADVHDKRGVWLCDHAWVTAPKGHQNLGLGPGDVVRFEARIGRYRKGYRGGDHGEVPVETDFRLEFLTGLSVLRRAES